MSETSDAPSDQLHKRAAQSRAKLWFFLQADRRVVVGILLGIVFGTLVSVGYLYSPAESAIRTSDSVDTLFQGLLTATITVVTLVLTVNQLVLSQELGAVKDQRKRMEGAMEFRKDVADVVQTPVSPSRPAQFLRALIDVSGQHAEELRNSIPNTANEELRREVEDITDSLIGNADQVSKGLDNARFGEFDVVSSALNFNYSWKIFAARRIHERYSDELDKTGTEALEQLIEALQLFGPAREHFKTLYFQWELINLSRRILVASILSLLVAGGMVIFFNDATYSVVIFDVKTLVVAVAAAATISLVPFLILLAYVMRIATVAKRTLSIGPFILRETEDVTEVEWNH